MAHPTHVTIDKLKLDEKANVRKTGRGAEKAFVANIEAKGILSSLTVRPNGGGVYLVTNACKQLKEMFGKGYQAKWESEKKAAIEKVAITKAKETGWLPPELRTSFYTGPGAQKRKAA